MSLPDLTTITTSSQIFDTTSLPSSPPYTLPQIRSIHKALHAAVDDKRSRLRMQVGGSYRDLLGTADAIVGMRGEMDSVLGLLSGLGGRCGRGVVGKKIGGLAGFVGEVDKGDGLGEVGRGRILGGCVVVVEGLLGKGGTGKGRGEGLVTAAKVLVLARLLGKSLGGKGPEDVKRLERSKRRLLKGVNKVLGRVGEKDTNREDVVRALAAYSLATSSGARDVLWQFLKVRREAMRMTFELDEDERVRSTEDVLRVLRLYTKTLLDVQALMPHKLTEALGGLKRNPLIKDAALRDIEGLRLDIYERWCGDEIEYFTPFIRHDDLDGKQAREMLGSWAKNGAEVLLKGLERTLDHMTELKAIVELRTAVLKLWIADGGRAKGFDPSELLDRIRKTINQQMLNVVESKVSKLRLVGSEVAATLESWREGITEKQSDIWEQDSFDMELANGAAIFAQEVVSRLYGRNDAVSRAVSGYKSWCHVIDDVSQVVEQLQRQRWENDDDEIEDEETIEERQQLLSKDDPRALQDSLNSSLVTAYKALDQQLRSSWDPHSDGPTKGQIAMYLLRVVRDTRAKLPDLEAVKGLGLEMLPQLHEVVASTAVETPLEDFISKVLTRKLVVGRSLWEGEPELPTSPSPGVFKFLRDLSMAMSDAGMDLWYPALLTAMKQHLGTQLHQGWFGAVEKLVTQPIEEKSDDEEDAKDKEAEETKAKTAATNSTAEQRKHLLIQWQFDILYLQCCLTTADLKQLEASVQKHTSLDKSSVATMTKSSQDYWRRTSLLFGLLT